MSDTKTRPFFKRVLSDPLLHFLVVGAALYLLAPLVGNKESSKDEITITAAGQKHLADLFELTWQRTPAADELKNLVQEHIKEEIYYREALALGLDENDTIVRRRMRQKLEFMQEDLSSTVQPTEVQLKEYFIANNGKYTTGYIISLTQMVVSSKRLEADALEIRHAFKKLIEGQEANTLSRSSLLPVKMNLETKKSISNTFGSDFTEQIIKLGNGDTGKWGGPIYSGFGTHMVNVSLIQNPKPLTFAQARNKVSVDYMQSQREKSASNYYRNLRDQYRITIEGQK